MCDQAFIDEVAVNLIQRHTIIFYFNQNIMIHNQKYSELAFEIGIQDIILHLLKNFRNNLSTRL